MQQPDEFQRGVLIALLGVLLLASIAAWRKILRRWRRGTTVAPYEPRRPVPWGGGHLLVVALVYLMGFSLLAELASRCCPSPPKVYDVEQSDRAHPVALLLEEDFNPLTIAACFAAVVLVAPVAEEFLFRLLLQGWLEGLERRHRRKLPTLGRITPGLGPVLLVALLFARMHFRVRDAPVGTELLIFLVFGNAVLGIAIVVIIVALLRNGAGASAADLGFVRARFADDVRLGTLAFAAVAFPVYLLQIGGSILLPDYVAPDPIALFPFALALGILYYRTHRLVASIVLHMCLNAVSFVVFLVTIG